MLVVMQSHATEEQVRAVCQRIESLGLKAHPIPGAARTAIGVTGNDGAVDLGVLESLPGVIECIPVSKPYKLVSRDAKAEDTILRTPRRAATSSSADRTSRSSPARVPSKPKRSAWRSPSKSPKPVAAYFAVAPTSRALPHIHFKDRVSPD